VTALATITDNPAAGTTATLLSTAHDATLRQWTADTLNDALLGNPRDLPARPAAAVLLKDTTLLAACADRDSIGLWDLQHGRRTPARTDAGVLALAWAERNGQPVLVWSDTTRTIRTWNPATDPHAGLTLDSQSRVRTLATCRTPHGACLLLGAGDDYRTRLWDLDSGSLLRTWHGHTMSVKATAAAAGSDGQIWLATGGTEGVVRLWDPDQPHHSSAEIHCDQGLISALAFSPEPTEGLPPFLATGGDQTPVRLWDLLTSSWLEQEFPGPATPAAALTTFTVNDRHSYVAAATHDGLVHIWHAASARRVLQIATGAPVTRLHARPQPAGHMVILAISGQAGVLVTALDFSHRALVH
jgi:WD40 repeat protein